MSGFESPDYQFYFLISNSHRLSSEAHASHATALHNAHPVATPVMTGVTLSICDSPTTAHDLMLMNNVPYQNAIGALNHYVVMTHPDISLALQKVSQFAMNPGIAH